MSPFSLATRSLRGALVLAVALGLTACSGSGPVDPGPTPLDPTGPQTPAYETFDPTGFDAAPSPRVEVVHDVPASVMAGRVRVPGQTTPQSPQPQQVDGFRIQIFESTSGQAARRIRDQAATWWETARSQSGAPARLDIIMPYTQPHYKVRVGAFATQDDADRVLGFVQRQYPAAFIVPDRVTVYR